MATIAQETKRSAQGSQQQSRQETSDIFGQISLGLRMIDEGRQKRLDAADREFQQSIEQGGVPFQVSQNQETADTLRQLNLSRAQDASKARSFINQGVASATSNIIRGGAAVNTEVDREIAVLRAEKAKREREERERIARAQAAERRRQEAHAARLRAEQAFRS